MKKRFIIFIDLMQKDPFSVIYFFDYAKGWQNIN